MDIKVLKLLIMVCVCILSNVENYFCLGENTPGTPSAVCPDKCSCSEDFVVLHCNNSFKIEGSTFASVTKEFYLERDFIGPVLNATFKQLVSVELIDISYSKVNYIQNGAFTGLSKLKKLYLQGNKIQMLDEHVFKDNLLLEVLDLSQNLLYYLQDEPFRFLPNLRTLNISFNMLTSARLGMRFQVPTRLTVIDFSGNRIENVTADDFATVQRWEAVPKSLNFSNCNLKYIEPDAIRAWKKLDFLGLASNKDLIIDNISVYLDTLSEVTLKKLDLSNANISFKLNISEMTSENLGPSSLQELYLSGNGLNEIDENLLSYLTLKKLDLSRNNLSEISKGLARLTHLTYLDLSHNRISTIHELFKENIGNLQILKLSNNDLTNECGLNIERGVNLIEVDLSENLFETFSVPSQLRKVETLLLAGNKLHSINDGEPLVGLGELITLDLSENKITEIGSFMFRDSSKIQKVSFAGNEISSVSHQAFIPNCPKVLDLSRNSLEKVHHFGWNHLSEIILSRNMISEVEPQAFFFMESLRKLDLSGNSISNLDVAVFSHLTNLTELYLQQNNLSQLLQVPGILAPLQNLLRIDLSFNNFTSFDFSPLPFSKNFKLREVSISNNRIREFSPYVFASLGSLEAVDFSRNPFHCSCENVPLQEWSRQTKVNIERQKLFGYICRSPSTRGTNTLMDFETRTFECSRYLFYIVVFCSSGLGSMLIAVSTAAICYFYRRRKRGEVDFEKKSQDIDLVGYEKVNETQNSNQCQLDAVTPEEFIKSMKDNYLKGSPSDTLIDIEFENPNLLIDNEDDQKIINKKQPVKLKRDKLKSRVTKSKNDQHKMSDAKKLKYYAQLYDILHENNTKNGNNLKKSDKQNMKKVLDTLEKEYKRKRNEKDGLKKMLVAMDKEYKKIQEKKHSSRRHGRERHKRSRGNKELVRMVSLKQSKSMPDVLSYVNSLPRHRFYDHDYRYSQIPIYHIDHADKSHHGWARSMVDIPRSQRISGAFVGMPGVAKRRGYSYERFVDDDRIPHGYHTVSSGRRAIMVDSRLAERSRSTERVRPRLSRERLLDDEGRPLIIDVRRSRSTDRIEERLGREPVVSDRVELIPDGYHTIATVRGTALANGQGHRSNSGQLMKRKSSKSENQLSPWV